MYHFWKELKKNAYYNRGMWNDNNGIDYERENYISEEYYRKGYFDGSNKATSDMVSYLINLPDEKLLDWKKKTIEMRSFFRCIIQRTE